MGLFGKENLTIFDDDGEPVYYSSEDYDTIINLNETYVVEQESNFIDDYDEFDDFD